MKSIWISLTDGMDPFHTLMKEFENIPFLDKIRLVNSLCFSKQVDFWKQVLSTYSIRKNETITKRYDKYTVIFSHGRRHEQWFPNESLYPSGLFIRPPSNYQLSDLQELIHDIHTISSSFSFYHPTLHTSMYYHEKTRLCSPFFKALHSFLFPSFPQCLQWITLPYFSLRSRTLK